MQGRHEELTQWSDFHARQYDAAVGRWFGVDPQNQFASPYTGMGNNPVMMVDPDGELAWFVPMIIGAVIGGTTGGIAAKNNGYSTFGGIWRGALIGAAAGGAGAGASAMGAGAMLAGAAGGAVGGAGFSGMATGWDGQAMLKGAAIGAASGFVGGGFASAIGGGGGAFSGGVAADITGQLLSTGDVNLGQSLLAGGLSLGLYHGSTYLNYQCYKNNHIPNQGPLLSYRQFNGIGVAYQKSRFWKKEFGGYLMDNGSVKNFSASERRSFAIIPEGGIPNDAWGLFHSHWENPGELIFHNSNYNRPTEMDILTGNITSARASRWHSPADLSGHGELHSFVINRYDASYLKPNWLAAIPFTGGFPRFQFFLPYFGY